jgi:hydrogenase expression/formation protein HypD
MQTAVSIALDSGVVTATFGDMLKVKDGLGRSLSQVKSLGADVNVVYSPLDVIKMAVEAPGKHFMLIAVGFETTAPMFAGLIKTVRERNINNIFLYSMLKTMPQVINSLLSDGENLIDGFLCPGNVTVITGMSIYEPIVLHKKAAVVTGFEPVEILSSILIAIRQINNKSFKVVNNYRRVCPDHGSATAQKLVNTIFAATDANWRGLGELKGSGLKLREDYASYDIQKVFSPALSELVSAAKKPCRCGEILKGKLTPAECELFSKVCTPENAFGPCMVSSEGTCAAYYKYGA